VFDNIIGQKKVISSLKQEIRDGRVPQSLLFYGKPYTGKLTAALEMARSLTCEKEKAEWSCTCRACELQRLLIYKDTVLLGSRYFSQEIAASADVLKRNEKEFARYLFIRAVRKMLRRFDPFLWEGNEIRLRKIQPAVQEAEEMLEVISPGNPLPDGKKLAVLIGKIEERCRIIERTIITDNIPVDQVRKAVSWAHTSTTGKHKVIILENADRMQDSSRNALLKVLEEPPEGVFFILTTTRKEGIIPTILSRLRSYYFEERSKGETGMVLEKIFREDPEKYAGLKEYFMAWSNINPESLKTKAVEFLQSVLSEDDRSFDFNAVDRNSVIPFLEELVLLLRKALRKEDSIKGMYERIDLDHLEKWNSMIKDCVIQIEQFNQRTSLSLESLYYKMRGMYEKVH